MVDDTEVDPVVAVATSDAMRVRRRPSAALAAPLAALTLLLCTGLVAFPAPRALADEPTVAEIGQMPAPSCSVDSVQMGCVMSVDEERSLGFTFGFITGGKALVMYDLDRLVPLHWSQTYQGRPLANFNIIAENLVVDEERQRVYVGNGYPNEGRPASECASGLFPDDTLRFAFSYAPDSSGRRVLTEIAPPKVPCAGTHRFQLLTGWFHRPSDSFYAAGTSAVEGLRGPNQGTVFHPLKEDDGQLLLVRQMRRTATGDFTLDWEIDLKNVGCGRRHRSSGGQMTPFVQRIGNDVLTYCWDQNPSYVVPLGAQGYLVRIPLLRGDDGVMRPATVDGGPPRIDAVTGTMVNYRARRFPTLGGLVTPLADPVSRKVLLVTANPVNGNAIWVVDPFAERFVGVISGGYASQPPGNTAVGLDGVRGRTYLLTQAGLLVAPVRSEPLSAGLLHPVVANVDGVPRFAKPSIAVAPRLRRLVISTKVPDQPGTFPALYRVVQDDTPADHPPETSEPDALTEQIDERPGETRTVSSGRGIASGAHVLVTGGIPRAVDQLDPLCYVDLDGDPETPADTFQIEPQIFDGACLAEQAVASGHRELSVAATDVNVGSATGSTARGSPLVFEANDRATDADISALGACEEGKLRTVTSPRGGESTSGESEPDRFEDYREGCDDLQSGVEEHGGPDLRHGTRGADSRGFPAKGAECGDYFTGAQEDAQSLTPSPAPAELGGSVASASAACDAESTLGRARSVGTGFVLGAESPAPIAVAGTESVVTSSRTPSGQLTVAYSSASGVQIGPLAIGKVESLAVTRAKGRTGTASTVLARRWCAVRLGDDVVQPGCLDPAGKGAGDSLDALNQILQRVRVGVPLAERQATPGGYQAVVTKDPGVRGADAAVNDDESYTVPALQAIWYNDGHAGRSRVVVQLASVHAESRYGVTRLPVFPDDPGRGGGDPPLAPEETTSPRLEPERDGAVGEPAVAVPPSMAVGTTEESYMIETVREDRLAVPQTVLPPAPGGRTTLTKTLLVPVDALRGAITLLVQHPREFGLLFALWSILASPWYLARRRRVFAREVAVASATTR